MASSLPIPAPPRTPTPPSDDSSPGPDVPPLFSPMRHMFDRNSLSPMVDTFPAGIQGTVQEHSPELDTPNLPVSIFSTNSLTRFWIDSTGSLKRDTSENVPGPFNFQPTTLAKGPVLKSNVGQRRGHKYKHSSISHQIFLEPPPRAPLALPNSLPIPTLAEYRSSLSTDQIVRFWWSICHMLVAGHTMWMSSGSMAMMGLSHLLLFDSLGAFMCVVVDVLGNFEVWKRSSVRHPFGLERAEVVAGFALAVLLFFLGGDLVSHAVQHQLENSGHAPHHSHSHERVSPGSIDMTALLAVVATLVSAIGLKNHARIGRAMRFAYIESLPSVLSNPAHFLTLSCSCVLLLLPLLSLTLYTWLDKVLALTIAISMCSLGVRLVKTLGSMLLMSYSGPGVPEVLRDISAHPSVSEVEEARFWQAHYGLCMANIKLRVTGTEDSLVKLRERISSMIKHRLGGGYGSGNQKWEVSLQLTVEQP